MANKFISRSGKEYDLDKSKLLMTDKPKSFIGKCIHTFKCIFNPGGEECVKFAKDELNAMTKAELELVGRAETRILRWYEYRLNKPVQSI